jgi:hypothetical protein
VQHEECEHYQIKGFKDVSSEWSVDDQDHNYLIERKLGAKVFVGRCIMRNVSVDLFTTTK